jgi:hypothetical protein
MNIVATGSVAYEPFQLENPYEGHRVRSWATELRTAGNHRMDVASHNLRKDEG